MCTVPSLLDSFPAAAAAALVVTVLSLELVLDVGDKHGPAHDADVQVAQRGQDLAEPGHALERVRVARAEHVLAAEHDPLEERLRGSRAVLAQPERGQAVQEPEVSEDLAEREREQTAAATLIKAAQRRGCGREEAATRLQALVRGRLGRQGATRARRGMEQQKQGADMQIFVRTIHGTTLATNALIERKGAKTALITTDGFRDSIEIAYEHRFDQYDLYMERPPTLTPRHLRFGVPERMASDGSVLMGLDEAALKNLIPVLAEEKIEALPSFNPTTRRIQRLLIGHATDTEVDTNGRMLLSSPLREYAQLGKKVVLIGQGKKFELWDEELWNQRMSEWLGDNSGVEMPEALAELTL